MKLCRKCGASSEEVAFAKQRKFCVECFRENQREWMRRRRAMAGPDIEALRKKQDGKCAICRKEKPLVLDHCHESGTIRGLLCGGCNSAIGFLREDPRIIHSATQYVLKNAEHRLEGKTPP